VKLKWFETNEGLMIGHDGAGLMGEFGPDSSWAYVYDNPEDDIAFEDLVSEEEWDQPEEWDQE
jgi:hypothetical protein